MLSNQSSLRVNLRSKLVSRSTMKLNRFLALLRQTQHKRRNEKEIS